jgi:surfeit locus 1 family protein
MTSRTRQFHAQALPTIVMVLLVCLFTGLGIWQLDRAEQKRSLAAAQDAQRQLPPLSLNNGIPETETIAFRHVSASGDYLFGKTVLIENRKHQGKTGFHVITPLQLEASSQVVLVNRGWIPRDQYQGLESITPTNRRVTVQGKVHIPQPPAIEMGQPDLTSRETPRWPYLTLDNYTAWSGLTIAPFAILQSPGDVQGFVRHWPATTFSDGMHIGYAIQWFAFALIALIIWWRLSMRPINQGVKA